MAGVTRTGERGGVMNSADVAGGGTRPSPLLQMTQTTPTCLWNDSASPEELAYAIEHGAVGATCNPVIALSILKREMPIWRERIDTI